MFINNQLGAGAITICRHHTKDALDLVKLRRFAQQVFEAGGLTFRTKIGTGQSCVGHVDSAGERSPQFFGSLEPVHLRHR